MDEYFSPAELRRLVSALLAVLGFLALAVLFAFLVVPGLRYQANTPQEGSAVPIKWQTGWLDPTDYPPARKQIVPPIDPKTVLVATPELLARGKDLFGRTCAACHGEAGKGDGPGGKGLNPPPRNLTSSTGWVNGTRIEDVYRTLDQGIPGSSMVSYNYLSRKDRMALVHYVQSLGAFDHGQSDPPARLALENLLGSTGETIPNRIPVPLAMRILANENQSVEPLHGIDSDPFLREAVLDPARAARTLAGDPSWKSSDQALANLAVAGAPSNGFSPTTATFSPSSWTRLRSILTKQ